MGTEISKVAKEDGREGGTHERSGSSSKGTGEERRREVGSREN